MMADRTPTQAGFVFGSESGATLSTDRRYRYRLWRSWRTPPEDVSKPVRPVVRCVFVGLNPSTADEQSDDQTIRKCVGFAKQWTAQADGPRFGAIDMVNLFAFRSTDPLGLLSADDPVGPDNDRILGSTFETAARIVFCWGQHPPKVRNLVRARIESAGWQELLGRFRIVRTLGTFGATASGAPRHPVMLAYATPFVREQQP